jgi:hypothetical protein
MGRVGRGLSGWRAEAGRGRASTLRRSVRRSREVVARGRGLIRRGGHVRACRVRVCASHLRRYKWERGVGAAARDLQPAPGLGGFGAGSGQESRDYATRAPVVAESPSGPGREGRSAGLGRRPRQSRFREGARLVDAHGKVASRGARDGRDCGLGRGERHRGARGARICTRCRHRATWRRAMTRDCRDFGSGRHRFRGIRLGMGRLRATRSGRDGVLSSGDGGHARRCASRLGVTESSLDVRGRRGRFVAK